MKQEAIMTKTVEQEKKKNVVNNLSIKDDLYYLLQRSKGIPIITDLKEYNQLYTIISDSSVSELSDFQLTDKVQEIRVRIQQGENSSREISDLFVLVNEVCKRTLNLIPYAEQIICAIAMCDSNIAQMNTGEGKTLAAVFAASFKALAGKGIHILTANEYLARRDALWMAPVYRMLGLTVDSVQESMTMERKREAYNADVTYLTVRQSGFDFLSDNLTWEIENRIQRPFHSCLVDEADFIMIDEARIPLVIAGDDGDIRPDPILIKSILPELRPKTDFTEDRAKRDCNLTVKGQKKVEKLLNCGGIHNRESANYYAAVHVALHAEYQLHRDIDYIVRNRSIELVDEFTGRIAEGRKWPDGIQGALEAKEGIDVQPEGKIFSSITIHGLLNLYNEKSGMTATAAPAAGELYNAYNLKTVIIPPHISSRFVELPDKVFSGHKEKMFSIQQEIARIHKTGRPILVGTASVRESEELKELLSQSKVSCRVLNAKNDEKEAKLIAEAGMWKAVTISTNMAGRGTDIKLGGTDSTLYREIVELGGLYVIGTTRFESKRIDNQLRGRAARQGDPGECRFFISLQDPLIQRFGILEFIPKEILKNKNPGIIESSRIAKEITRAQESIENQHASMREALSRYSEMLERPRKQFFLLREEIIQKLSAMTEENEILPLMKLQSLPDDIFIDIEDNIQKLQKCYGRDKTGQFIYRFLLQEIDRFWADQLSSASERREGIHLVRYASKVPLYVFINEMIELFDLGINQVFNNLKTEIISISQTEKNKSKLPSPPKGPSSTWTYQLNDNPLSFFGVYSIAGITNNVVNMMIKVMQVLFLAPVLFLGRQVKKMKKNKHN